MRTIAAIATLAIATVAAPATAAAPAGFGGGDLRLYISTDEKTALGVWTKNGRAHILASDFVPPSGHEEGLKSKAFCFTGKVVGPNKYRGKSIGTYTDAPLPTRKTLTIRGGKRMTMTAPGAIPTHWRRATKTAVIKRGIATGSSSFSFWYELPYLHC